MGQLVADQGPRARQHLAYQALGEWTPQEREAIRTLAATSPEVRAQAFGETGESTAGFGESSEPKPHRAAASGGTGTPPPAPPTGKPGAVANGGTKVRTPQDQPRSPEGGS